MSKQLFKELCQQSDREYLWSLKVSQILEEMGPDFKELAGDDPENTQENSNAAHR
jgi:hypothetical protein